MDVTSAATVAFKLSVARSFFEYLKAAGAVPLNPASTKLVSPPELPSEPSGRALSTRIVQKIVMRRHGSIEDYVAGIASATIIQP